MVQRVTFRRFVVGSLVAAVLIGGCMASARAETHRFKPTVGYPTFAKREPVLHVKPGDIVETETLWGEWYERAGGKWPGEVGPFHVEGATPNDTLAVKILRLRPNRDVAVSTHNPQFGVLAADRWTPMLTDPIPAKRFIWKLDRGRMVGFDSHDRLLATCETYRQLWASQAAFVHDWSAVPPRQPEVVDA